MPETATLTQVSHAGVTTLLWDWESAGDGSVTGATTSVHTGKVVALLTDPDSGGDAPSDNYDIVVNDSDTLDVLAGGGANRSATVVQGVAAASLGAVVNSTLTLEITNAGNAKKGIVKVYITRIP